MAEGQHRVLWECWKNYQENLAGELISDGAVKVRVRVTHIKKRRDFLFYLDGRIAECTIWHSWDLKGK